MSGWLAVRSGNLSRMSARGGWHDPFLGGRGRPRAAVARKQGSASQPSAEAGQSLNHLSQLTGPDPVCRHGECVRLIVGPT